MSLPTLVYFSGTVCRTSPSQLRVPIPRGFISILKYERRKYTAIVVYPRA